MDMMIICSPMPSKLVHCDIANGVLFIGDLYPCCGVCGLIHEHYTVETSMN